MYIKYFYFAILFQFNFNVMKKILLFTVSFLKPFLHAWAQNEDSVLIRTIADEILVNGKAYENLRVLTKQIGGRLTGSPQMVKAEVGLATQ